MNILLGFLLLSAALETARAQTAEVKMVVFKPIGGLDWGKDGYFKIKWSHDAETAFAGVDVARSRKEVWVVSASGHNRDQVKLSVLDVHGETVREARFAGRFKKFRIWEAGEKLPRLVCQDELSLTAFGGDGARLWSYDVPKHSPSDFAVMPKDWGKPLIAAAYGYGDAGVRAIDAKGRLAWESPEVPRAGWINVDRPGRKGVIAASDGIGKIYLLDDKGKITERITGEGNMDRVMFAGEGLMYGLNSGAESWTETIQISTADAKAKGGRRWSRAGVENLGPITTTAFALGDFDGSGSKHPVIGTDNGWIFVLDESGRKISEARFRGKILSLAALDLNGDGKDELIVGIDGYSNNVLVFTRPGGAAR